MAVKDLQNILDSAVADGIPGITAVAIDRPGIAFQGLCISIKRIMDTISNVVSLAGTGVARVLSTETNAHNDPYAVHWLASLPKLPVSLAVLKLLEERTEPSLGLEQLDHHKALLKIFPEFRLGGGHMVTKILEGIDTNVRLLLPSHAHLKAPLLVLGDSGRVSLDAGGGVPALLPGRPSPQGPPLRLAGVLRRLDASHQICAPGRPCP
jgi:hypothetical protein